MWFDSPPADSPVPRATLAQGIAFTGRHANCTGIDTWQPAWGMDDALYSLWSAISGPSCPCRGTAPRGPPDAATRALPAAAMPGSPAPIRCEACHSWRIFRPESVNHNPTQLAVKGGA